MSNAATPMVRCESGGHSVGPCLARTMVRLQRFRLRRQLRAATFDEATQVTSETARASLSLCDSFLPNCRHLSTLAVLRDDLDTAVRSIHCFGCLTNALIAGCRRDWQLGPPVDGRCYRVVGIQSCRVLGMPFTPIPHYLIDATLPAPCFSVLPYHTTFLPHAHTCPCTVSVA